MISFRDCITRAPSGQIIVLAVKNHKRKSYTPGPRSWLQRTRMASLATDSAVPHVRPRFRLRLRRTLLHLERHRMRPHTVRLRPVFARFFI